MMVPRQGGNAAVINVIMFGSMIAIFYFLLIRPQAKERQRHEAILASVKKGDDIVTTGGIIGKVVHVEDERLTLRTGEDTRVTVDRSRIAAVLDLRGEAKED